MLEGARETAEVQSHSHHAIQITFGLKGEFVIETEHGRLRGPVVAVASDTHHSFRASGAVAFLFIEPESAAGRALHGELFKDRPAVDLATGQAHGFLESLRNCFDQGATGPGLVELGRSIVAALPRTGAHLPPDARVTSMITYARTHLDDRLTLASAAKHVGLSFSRASHLFVAQTGLAFKSYLLWLRLEIAVALYAGGQSLTESAHQAGFADSAHFSRTFRRTFGLPSLPQCAVQPPSTTSDLPNRPERPQSVRWVGTRRMARPKAWNQTPTQWHVRRNGGNQ